MKESKHIVDNGNAASRFGKLGQKLASVKIPTPTSLNFGHALGGAAGVVVSAMIMGSFASSPPLVPNGAGQNLAGPVASAPPVVANGDRQDFDGPTFTNPCEISYHGSEKRVRGVIEIVSGMFLIPNVGRQPMRQYHGLDPAAPCPTPTPGATNVPNVGPGPTLRARLGDQMQISFFNKAIDRTQDASRTFFPYSLDTTSKPGEKSSFGCDQSGTTDASGTMFPYPANDKFPNCFHGSSTANIHFHGTHTSPDGLADNVLVQVLADMNQQDWTATFNQMFDTGKIPQRWLDMPEEYRKKQSELISKHDDAEAELATRNSRPSPARLSDDNDRRIAAGEWPQYIMGAFPNFFDIPDYSSGNYQAGQAPGTHWYHAHKHGSTSLHMLNGLAGAFIIESNKEGGYDHFIRKSLGWPSYEGHEKIFVFQQFDSSQSLKRDKDKQADASRVLVNGLLTPTIYMRPGEIQLWRLVNATESKPIVAGNSTTSLFQTVGFTFRQTAQDGVQFSKDNYANQPFLNPDLPGGPVPGGMTLAAANRVDMLVQAPTTLGRTAFKNGNGNDVLFFVRVVGEPMPPNTPPIPSDWTADPLPFLQDLPAPPAKDNPNFVQFQWEAGRQAPGPNDAKFQPHFMINGKQFSEYGEVVDQCMPQDGLQDWILENYTAEIAHPFHIHINPFQVIQIDVPAINPDDPTKYPIYGTYAPTKNFIWQDVIAIPPAVISGDGRTIAPGRVRIRHKFLDFTGTYVLHCHILQHEDRGMMQLVRVVPARNYPSGCQMNIPAHH